MDSGKDNHGFDKSSEKKDPPPDYSESDFKESDGHSGERIITWEPYGKMTHKAFNRRVWWNIIVLSFAFMCNYVSYGGLANLQSSLHVQDGMGTICTSIRYVALVLSCIFVPRLMIRLMTHKWTMTVSLIGFVIWEAANGYGIWATMVPASIINGIFVAPLWAAQGSYFTELSREYALVNNQNEETTIALFFGVYYAFYIGAGIFGNVISSTILKSSPPENYTGPTDEDIAAQCGMVDCPWNSLNNTNLEKPPDNVVWTLVGIYMVIGICSILITIFLVDHLPRHLVKESGLTVKQEFWSLVTSTLRHTAQKKQLLIIPLTVYMGLSGSYYGAEFNRSWVTCALGIWMIGVVSIPFSIAGAIVSFVAGRLVKIVGRIPIFVVCLCVTVTFQVFIATWTVNPNKTGVFFAVSTLWGSCDAIWITLVGVLYGIFFPNESEAAFSNHMLWWCVGLALGFGYSSSLCTDTKLYMLFSVLWVGIFCYFGAEYVHKKYSLQVPLEPEEEKVKGMEMQVSSYRTRQQGSDVTNTVNKEPSAVTNETNTYRANLN